MEFEVITRVPANLRQVQAGFTESLFRFVIPPGSRICSLEFGGCQPGNELRMKLKLFGILTQRWHNRITTNEQLPGIWAFTDVGLEIPFPLKSWEHRHLVEEIDPVTCLIRDQVRFTTKPGWIGILLLPILRLPFILRKSRYRVYFRHQEP